MNLRAPKNEGEFIEQLRNYDTVPYFIDIIVRNWRYCAPLCVLFICVVCQDFSADNNHVALSERPIIHRSP